MVLFDAVFGATQRFGSFADTEPELLAQQKHLSLALRQFTQGGFDMQLQLSIRSACFRLTETVVVDMVRQIALCHACFIIAA